MVAQATSTTDEQQSTSKPANPLTELRQSLGLTREGMALLAGVSRGYWTEYERTGRPLGPKPRKALAAHGIDVEALLARQWSYLVEKRGV